VADDPILLSPTWDVTIGCPLGCDKDELELWLTTEAKPMMDLAGIAPGALHMQPAGVVVASCQRAISKMVDQRDSFVALNDGIVDADAALGFLMIIRDTVLAHRGAAVDVVVSEASRSIPLEEPVKEYMSCWSIAKDHDILSVESAKKMSHDNVVLGSGSHRRSGVSWTFWSTDDAPVLRGDNGYELPLPADVSELCQLHPGLTLVMATVEVEFPNEQ
jgi:hypothetical protein